MIRALIVAASFGALIACGVPVADEETGAPRRIGGTWTAVSIPGLDEFDPHYAPRVQFTLDGTVRGAAGCFDFSAPVQIAGEHIAVGQLGLQTDPGCTAQRAAVGRAFLEALVSAETMSGGLPGDRLILTGSEGDLVFAQPRPSPPG